MSAISLGPVCTGIQNQREQVFRELQIGTEQPFLNLSLCMGEGFVILDLPELY